MTSAMVGNMRSCSKKSCRLQLIAYCLFVLRETCLPTGRRGSVPGYKMFLEAVSDPSHPEYEDVLEWTGGNFDPEHFDLAEVNDLLREYCD